MEYTYSTRRNTIHTMQDTAGFLEVRQVSQHTLLLPTDLDIGNGGNLQLLMELGHNFIKRWLPYKL